MWKGVPVTLIVAMSENRCIGKDGAMPWHLPADLKRFKRVTMGDKDEGHPMIMGRKTFQSIGRVLPGRPSIVVTRDASFRPAGVQAVTSLEAALDAAAGHGTGQIMVIGGGQIYAEALTHADVLDICEIHAEIAGDTFFPEFDRAQWCETFREDHPANSADDPAFAFVRLMRA